MQALGLLLRANPKKWWRHVSPLFADILVNPNHAAMAKDSVISTYGKIAHHLRLDSNHFIFIRDFLMKLSDHPSILVSRPATVALCNFSLVHSELFPKVFEILSVKLRGSMNQLLPETPPSKLQHFLRVWCKMVSRDYRPTGNLRAFISDSATHIQQVDSYPNSCTNYPF